MKLRNIAKAIISEDKIRDYLLSDTHPVGRFKAKVFKKSGYSRENWDVLKSDLKGF